MGGYEETKWLFFYFFEKFGLVHDVLFCWEIIKKRYFLDGGDL